ncbi:hypothetical protein ACI77N_10940 [Pseudomonas sp. S191]|uniref:hypothetical protein n=1 Tax=Pseudomonas sp. S191 TaxID=579575 RepID=UPI00387AD80F
MASLQAPGEGAGFVVVAAKPHDLIGSAIHNMEELTTRRYDVYLEGNHGRL